jgi:hypothetical protein
MDAHPPTSPDFDPSNPDLFREPPKWPKVTGIISIVLASLGLVCGGCGMGWLAFMPTFMKNVESQMGGPMPDAMMPGMGQLALMGVQLLWSVLLLVAGIATLKRNEAGKKLHVLYAIGAMLLGLLGLALQYQQLQTLNEWVAANPDNKWAIQQKQGQPFQYIGMCVGVVVGLGYPIFCIIWFGFVKRRAPME